MPPTYGGSTGCKWSWITAPSVRCLRFDHDVRGVTPTPITNFVEDRRLISASVAGFYLQSWSLEAGYTRYFGAGRFNLLQDRDFMSLVAKYAF